MINQIGSSTVRILGMSSGMDTEALIKQMMQIQQARVDSKLRSRTTLEWKQQSLNSIKDDLTNFRQSFLSAAGSNSMRTSSVYNSTAAAVTGKNAGAVTILTTAASSIGNMSIGRITSLAKGAGVTSGGAVTRPTGGNSVSPGLSTSDMLGNVNFSYGDGKMFGPVNVTVDGATTALSFEDSRNSASGSAHAWIKSVIGETAYNDAMANNRTADDKYVQFDINGTTALLSVKEVVDANGDGTGVYEAGTESMRSMIAAYNGACPAGDKIEYTTDIEINGKTVTLNATDSVNDMIRKVSDSGAGATMSYDRLSDSFKIEANYGQNVDPSTTSLTISGGALNYLGLSQGTYNNGQQAVVEINGETITQNTNAFDYRGVRITLNRTTDDAGYNAAEDDIKIDFTRDVSKTLESIKGFVDAYNSIIAKLESVIKESKTQKERGYLPLTDEEKAAMTDKQIADWEAIAKKGLLRNDSGIQTLVTNLRRDLFVAVEGAGLSPSEIGLTTGNYFDGKGGQIVLNEDKLKAALEADPERVMNVFMGTARNENGELVGTGLTYRMDNLMNEYVRGSQSRSLDSLEESIRRTNEQVEKLQRKMYEEEERLYKKFAALETALANLESQGSWLQQMVNQNNSNKK